MNNKALIELTTFWLAKLPAHLKIEGVNLLLEGQEDCSVVYSIAWPMNTDWTRVTYPSQTVSDANQQETQIPLWSPSELADLTSTQKSKTSNPK